MEFPESTIIRPARRICIAFVLLSILTFFIYSNSFDASWHLDDYQNIQTKTKLHINDLQPKTLWGTFFSSKDNKLYRPLPCLTFALNWYVGKAHVFGYHLVNISIHFLTSFFLFCAILNLFNSPNLKERYVGKEHFIALLAAVLWAVNPIQTQGVTYIVQRMASMAAMFYIISIYFYIKARNSQKKKEQVWFFAGCFLGFLCALASKQNAATLPIALILVEAIFYRDVTNPKFRKVFAAAFLGVGILVVVGGVLVFGNDDPLFFLSGYKYRFFTPLERVMTEARIVVFYISQIFYPIPSRLSIEHDVVISKSLFEPWTTLPSILLIALIVAVGFWQIKKRPILSFAILFFFLNHLIESTIISLELIFEHRNYLPSLFLFFPVAQGMRMLLDYYENNRRMYYVFVSFVILLIAGFGIGSYVRNMDWKNDKTLWQDAIAKAPNSSRAYHNLAWGFFDKFGRYDEPIEAYEKALNRRDHKKSGNVVTYSNLSGIYLELGHYEKAAEYAEKAISSAPAFMKGYYKLAVSLAALGRWEEALAKIKYPSTKEKKNSKYLLLEGFLLIKANKYEEAITTIRQVLKRGHNNTKALINMGLAFDRIGMGERGLWFLRRAYALNSKNRGAILALIEVYSKSGNNEAASHYAEKLFAIIKPEETEKLLNPLSSLNITIPYSTELISPVISDKLKERSRALARISEKLNKK
ncbi:tetratricopeptide repeat protein [Thermodesulfobacteriota bacterium]